jgi:hypothetical protein
MMGNKKKRKSEKQIPDTSYLQKHSGMEKTLQHYLRPTSNARFPDMTGLSRLPKDDLLAQGKKLTQDAHSYKRVSDGLKQLGMRWDERILRAEIASGTPLITIHQVLANLHHASFRAEQQLHCDGKGDYHLGGMELHIRKANAVPPQVLKLFEPLSLMEIKKIIRGDLVPRKADEGSWLFLKNLRGKKPIELDTIGYEKDDIWKQLKKVPFIGTYSRNILVTVTDELILGKSFNACIYHNGDSIGAKLGWDARQGLLTVHSLEKRSQGKAITLQPYLGKTDKKIKPPQRYLRMN